MIENNVSVVWPPSYTVKRHRLAKSVKLRASASHGLEITTPYRFNPKTLPSILEEHKDWIIKQLQNIPVVKNDALPTKINFSALQTEWLIEYQHCARKLALIERPQKELVLVGDIHNKAQCQRLLMKWVREQAKIYLSQRLQALSESTRLFFDKLTIRNQKTRWGSCTADQSINLNYKLIFLPPELVTYVIIHELCHTKHLNHSVRFWRLVETFDVNWRTHRRALRHADKFIPPWAL